MLQCLETFGENMNAITIPAGFETAEHWNSKRCALRTCSGQHVKSMRDTETQKVYAYHTEEQVRDLFFHLLPQIPVQFMGRLAIQVTTCAFRTLTCKALWEPVSDERPLSDRFCAFGIDALRVVAAPLVLIAALGIAMTGVIAPIGAMKAWRVLVKLEGFDDNLQADPFDPESHKFHHIGETPVVLNDFHPWTEWTEVGGHNFRNSNIPQLIQNGRTEKLYFNDDRWTIRGKGALLIVGVPIIHSVLLVQNIAERVVRIVTFSHFWRDVPEENGHYSLCGRVCALSADVLRIALAPIALVGMELAAIYMVFNPLDGKKIYAAIEQLEYGSWNLPCMHPGYNPTERIDLSPAPPARQRNQ